jgi:Arc/MetJ-type ribon-helix-helix transcriptional regulator
MQNQKFDHALLLKMTSEMRDDIDRALILTQDTRIRTRSEFMRAACQLALDSLAGGWADAPVSVEERKERVLSGTDELDADRSDQGSAGRDNHHPEPRCG